MAPRPRSDVSNRRPTIRDVAREAGVGIGTASRALSGAKGVSPEAQARVEAASHRLGFEPSRAARALRGGKTQTIGVLIPFFTRHYFLEILRGVEEAASDHDYGLNIYNVERPEQAIKHLQFLTRTRRVDALIVVALDGGMLAPALPADPRLLPMVAVDTTIGQVPTIEVDYEEGMYSVVRHLLARGHKRIALIDRAADPVTDTPTDRRRAGYERAIRDARIDVDPHRIVTSEYSADGGRAGVAALLKGDRPTAFACASDLQAIGALQAVREAGLTVPGDVAITGFNDVEIAAYVGLTSVRVSAREMGRTAFDFGIALLNPKADRHARRLIPVSLIARDTS